jgi:hypothetical protein
VDGAFANITNMPSLWKHLYHKTLITGNFTKDEVDKLVKGVISK